MARRLDFRRTLASGFAVAFAVAILTTATALPAGAQVGSEGGSLGGSLEPTPAPAHRSRPPANPVHKRQRVRGGPGSNFDGAWQVSAGGGCSGAGTSQVTISGGRIIGPNGGGHVSRSGAVSTVGAFNGTSVTSEGRITGNSGRGVYRQSDGCSGPWFATKL